MSDDDGSLLARQVRRLLDKKPGHKVLKGLEPHIIQAIEELGDPDKDVVVPPHLYQKANFDNALKRLEDEFELLNIKDIAAAKAAKAAADEKAAADAAAKAAADKAAADKVAADAAAKAAADKTAADKVAADASAKAAADKAAQESRESSVDSTATWNTKASKSDSHLQYSGRWRRVRERLGDDDSDLLIPIQEAAEAKNCDYSDVLFFLEYILRREPDLPFDDLTAAATEFIGNAPGSQAKLKKTLQTEDPQLARAYAAYYAPTAQDEKKIQWWARNPQVYRDRILAGLPVEKEKDWDHIKLDFDPDTGVRGVEGRITASIAQFLDVCLPSLPWPGKVEPRNNEERHVLVLKSLYPIETTRFEDSERGGRLTLQPRKKGNLRGRRKENIKILNYSCAIYQEDGKYPRMYFVGIDKRQKDKVRAWARTTFCEYRNFKSGLDDLNDQRKACGQEKVTKEGRRLDIDPDSASDFESDDPDIKIVG